jgi:uncharacterized membrane protein HdeD (DUF308 family)
VDSYCARRPAAWAFVENWPTLILRGGAGIVAGVALFTTPHGQPEFLIPLLGSFFAIDGFFALLGSLRAPRRRELWSLPAAYGALSILLGVLAWRLPEQEPVQMLAVATTYALARGILESATAVELRMRALPERPLAFSAAVSLLAAWILILLPHLGLRGIRVLVALQLILGGMALIRLGRRLRARRDRPVSPAPRNRQAA